jgi:rhodanese-related sulfurtransferase
MKKTVFALSLLTLASFAAMVEITPQQAYEKQKSGALVVDVRTPQEYFYLGHGTGHINVPIFFEQFTIEDVAKRSQFSNVEQNIMKRATVPKNVYKITQIPNDEFVLEVSKLQKTPTQEIVLICKGGERSKLAADTLALKGFGTVYSVQNGFSGKKKEAGNGWINSELPWGGN